MKPSFPLVFASLLVSIPASATVNVSAPSAGATVTSPVHYIASATAATCAQGVASMGIYVNNQLVYVVNGAQLNTSISLATGNEHTVVEEWDKCGGATYTTINLTVVTPAKASVSIFASSPTITAGSATTLVVNCSGSEPGKGDGFEWDNIQSANIRRKFDPGPLVNDDLYRRGNFIVRQRVGTADSHGHFGFGF